MLEYYSISSIFEAPPYFMRICYPRPYGIVERGLFAWAYERPPKLVAVSLNESFLGVFSWLKFGRPMARV